jgi:hypothetical protein
MPASLRPFVPILTALVLAGCSEPVSYALLGANAVSLAVTEKFVGDHVMSWATGKECSALNSTRHGQYCLPPDDTQTAQVPAPPQYCYRTRGAITCYPTPDLEASASRRVQ